MDRITKTFLNSRENLKSLAQHRSGGGFSRLWAALLMLGLLGLTRPVGAVDATPKPNINPASGTYISSVTITMDCPSPTARIHYTLNGADPVATETNYNLTTEWTYGGPLSIYGMVGTTLKVKARAFDTGFAPSDVSSRDYTFSFGSTETETTYVDGKNAAGPWDGTQNFPYKTIQSAIDAAHSGNTIIVNPGTYGENIKFQNKNIALSSVNPKLPSCINATVIDGGGEGATVEFGGAETSQCILTGFTITNGGLSGISGHGTRATIDNNRIINNVNFQCVEETGTGAGATANNAFQYYMFSGIGGGIADCNGLIQNNIIAGNQAGGPINISNQTGLFYELDRTFVGAALHACNGTVRNNTIWGNTCYASDIPQRSVLSECTGVITNNIIWGNDADASLYLSSEPTYCDVAGYSGGALGMLNSDPLLVDPAHGDFHLTAASPCIDAGSYMSGMNADYEGNPHGLHVVSLPRGDNSHYDIGAYEFIPTLTTPTISPESGQVGSPFTVTLTSPDHSATIHYGLYDANTNNYLGGGVYFNPLNYGGTPGQSLRIDAYASIDPQGLIVSPHVTRTFTFAAPAPLPPDVNPPSGEYASPLRISISDFENDNVTIRYTLNGADPSATETAYAGLPTETIYSAPFLISGVPGQTVTVKVRALQSNHLPSGITVRTYTIPYPKRLFVDDDAPAGGNGNWQTPYRKIQDAIDTAANGDTIIVAPGTYHENIRFGNQNVILQSRDPHSWATILKTVIDGGANGPTVRFGGCERPDCILTGFTITNGRHPFGAGIAGENTHASIQNNYIMNNIAYGVTGVVTATHPQAGNPAVTVQELTRALTGQGGGLAYCQGPIQNNVIAYNTCATVKTADPGNSPGVIYVYHDSTLYQGSALFGCDGAIRNNTIYGNTGGDSVMKSCWGMTGNNIVWANYPASCSDCLTPTYSVIQDWAGVGAGNRALDPLLVDPLHNDFHLRTGSSAIDTAVTGSALQDLEGNTRGATGTVGIANGRWDIGAFEYLVAPPEMTPDGGTLGSPVTVTLKCATAGAAIRTTLDGKDPTESSALYGAPLVLQGAAGATVTVKARAFKAGLPASPVMTRTFTFAPLTITQISRTGVAADKLYAGRRIYEGRSLCWLEPIPAAFKGQTFLRTLYADKDSNAALSFTINQPATVVVAVSAGLKTLPAWLTGWTKMSETLLTNDTVAGRVLYKKSFPKGMVTLGANREGTQSTGQNPYSVIVMP